MRKSFTFEARRSNKASSKQHVKGDEAVHFAKRNHFLEAKWMVTSKQPNEVTARTGAAKVQRTLLSPLKLFAFTRVLFGLEKKEYIIVRRIDERLGYD